MSTIEEAREQAREALELIHTWAQREQAWDTPRALDFARIGASIRALLDATEPPAPLSVEDFITGTVEDAVDTDEFFGVLEAEPAPECSCPSGDGSLRWPCTVHMPDCARCGASLQGRRYATAQRDSRRGAYCHDDDMSPSCYERSSWMGFRELEPVLANVKIDPVLDIPAEQMSTEDERPHFHIWSEVPCPPRRMSHGQDAQVRRQ